MGDYTRHWQPVLLSRHLGRKPVHVSVGDRELVAFRTRSGQVGVLQYRCPHRGMPLSEGKVVGETLKCAYHGWCYAANGIGQSPGSPQLRLQADHFDAEDRFGLIWVKDSRSTEPFPDLAPSDVKHVHTIRAVVPTPVELLLDNFTEVEHTGVAHLLFGYTNERLHEVTFETTVEDGAVHSRSEGPQKRLLPGASAILGIETGDRFVVDWVATGDPLRAIYQMHWEDPRTGARRPYRMYEVAYFDALGPNRSAVAAMYFAEMTLAPVPGAFSIIKAFMAGLTEVEYRLDVRILRALKTQDRSLQHCKLSRFDSSLVEQRKLFFPEEEPSSPT